MALEIAEYILAGIIGSGAVIGTYTAWKLGGRNPKFDLVERHSDKDIDMMAKEFGRAGKKKPYNI